MKRVFILYSLVFFLTLWMAMNELHGATGPQGPEDLDRCAQELDRAGWQLPGIEYEYLPAPMDQLQKFIGMRLNFFGFGVNKNASTREGSTSMGDPDTMIQFWLQRMHLSQVLRNTNEETLAKIFRDFPYDASRASIRLRNSERLLIVQMMEFHQRTSGTHALIDDASNLEEPILRLTAAALETARAGSFLRDTLTKLTQDVILSLKPFVEAEKVDPGGFDLSGLARESGNPYPFYIIARMLKQPTVVVAQKFVQFIEADPKRRHIRLSENLAAFMPTIDPLWEVFTPHDLNIFLNDPPEAEDLPTNK